MSSKYSIFKNDGKNNSDEKYIVIRIDAGAKHRSTNLKHVHAWLNDIKNEDKKAYNEIMKFLNQYKESEIKEIVSNCCKSPIDENSDVCSKCKEHCKKEAQK